MIWLSTKELYRLFLESEWWVQLSRLKRRKVGRCERCGSRRRLESHHKVYRESWFDTVESDLEVLCHHCHAERHAAESEKVVEQPKRERKRPAQPVTRDLSALVMGAGMIRDLLELRQKGLITRKQFTDGKAAYSEALKPKKKCKKKKRTGRKFGPGWAFNISRKKNWVNRGTSSN